MTEIIFTEYVQGLGEVYRACAPLDEQIRTFNQERLSFVDVRDTSLIRLNGKNRGYTRTCSAPIYRKDSRVIVARTSPLITNLEMALFAVNRHRISNYAVFDDSVYSYWEKIIKEDKGKRPEDRRAIFLSSRDDFEIDKESDEARFFWRDTRERYFNEFANEIHCLQIPVDIVDSSNGTIVNHVWFGNASSCTIDLRGKGLHEEYRAFGYRETSKTPSRKNTPIGKLRERKEALILVEN